MFEWFKKQRALARAKEFERNVPRFVAAYAALLEKYPGAYIDQTWLPVSKPDMKRALKIAWLKSASNEQRAWIEAGWVFLAQFQAGVGPRPIDAVVSDAPSAENIAKIERYIQLGKKAVAEGEADYAELREFLRANLLHPS